MQLKTKFEEDERRLREDERRMREATDARQKASEDLVERVKLWAGEKRRLLARIQELELHLATAR